MHPHIRNYFTLRPDYLGITIRLGALAAIFTLLGFLGRYHWFCDLFSHFRLQYAVVSILIAIALWMMRRPVLALLASAVMLTNIITVAPHLTGRSPVPNHDSHKALLINVNTNLGSPTKVIELIKQEQPDIVVLEETDYGWLDQLQPLKALYPHHLLKPRSDNFGITVYSRWPLISEHVRYIGLGGIPSLLVTVETPDGPLDVIATHPVPPSGPSMSEDRDSQLYDLADHVNPEANTLLLGDLNTTPWNYHFRRLCQRANLVDSASAFRLQATWPTQLPILWIPLDHCLHSSNVQVHSHRTGTSVDSDHYPLIINFSLQSARED